MLLKGEICIQALVPHSRCPKKYQINKRMSHSQTLMKNIMKVVGLFCTQHVEHHAFLHISAPTLVQKHHTECKSYILWGLSWQWRTHRALQNHKAVMNVEFWLFLIYLNLCIYYRLKWPINTTFDVMKAESVTGLINELYHLFFTTLNVIWGSAEMSLLMFWGLSIPVRFILMSLLNIIAIIIAMPQQQEWY